MAKICSVEQSTQTADSSWRPLEAPGASLRHVLRAAACCRAAAVAAAALPPRARDSMPSCWATHLVDHIRLIGFQVEQLLQDDLVAGGCLVWGQRKQVGCRQQRPQAATAHSTPLMCAGAGVMSTPVTSVSDACLSAACWRGRPTTLVAPAGGVVGNSLIMAKYMPNSTTVMMVLVLSPLPAVSCGGLELLLHSTPACCWAGCCWGAGATGGLHRVP